MTVVYSAGLVWPVSAPPILDGAVAVRDGRIDHVGTRDWVLRTLTDEGIRDPVEIRWPGALLPGLVNAHTHLQYTCLAELGRVRYNSFEAWSDAFDARYAASENWAESAAAGARLAIESGTTAIADVVTDAPAASALADAGLHGVAYWEVMNWDNARWLSGGPKTVEAQLDAMPRIPGAGLSPHAPYTLGTAPLLELPDLVRRRGMRLHMHVAETPMEAELYRSFAPDGAVGTAGWRDIHEVSFQRLRARGVGVSATRFLDHLGVLGPDCHVAHGVHMSEPDRAILRSRQTSVALCPRSNRALSVGAPPVASYLNEGSPIAIGTDSLASADSLDLLADVALLYALAREQGYDRPNLAARLLAAATLGGAAALGLTAGPDRIGQLQVGARADLALFDVETAGVAPAIEALATDGAGRASATVIDGRVAWCSPAAAAAGFGDLE